jgi:hypothetical protein
MESAIDFVSIDVGSSTFANVTASFSSLSPTRIVRWRTVSTEGMSSSGKNSDTSVRVRRYGSEAPIFATTRSYSGVHRSAMISLTGLRVVGHSATAWLESGCGNIHGTEQRQKAPRPLVLDGARRPAPLTSPPPAAMILSLCLNEVVLQSGEHERPSARVSPMVRGEYSSTAAPSPTS